MRQKRAIWHPIGFILCHLVAIALYGSWLYPPSRTIWDTVDSSVFYSLNGSLAWGEQWQLFLAWANTKFGDIAAGLVMILFFLGFVFADRAQFRVERLGMFGVTCLMVLLSQDGQLVNIYEGIISVERASPSLVLEPVLRLSQLQPQIPAKDAALSSFPGDHGVVVMIWLACMIYFASWRWSLTGSLLALLVVLPRMVGGGHWLSDNLVGSGTLVLLMAAWILCTPVTYLLQLIGESILGFILPRSWRRLDTFY